MEKFDVKEHLIQNDQEFRQLVERHQNYECKLQELQTKRHLSTNEQLEETVIKKKKLAIKDQMQLFIHRYQVEHSVH